MNPADLAMGAANFFSRVTGNNGGSNVETAENSVKICNALVALVPGAITGASTYLAIKSGILASTILLATPLGWSIGAGALIFGLNFLLLLWN